MIYRTIACFGGALLLSSAGAALAAGGTTVVPAGQSADLEIVAAASSDEASGAGAADAAAQGTEASGEAGTAGSETQPAASEGTSGSQAASDAAQGQQAGTGEADKGADGAVTMSNVENPEADDHPSKDTKDEGNTVASFRPNDASEDPGLALDSAEKPVYAFAEGGSADWYAWRGYKKYGANCLQCHGPDGMGSSFAPNLTEVLQDIDYYEFAGIIVSGQQNVWNPSGNSIMPAWGEDPNVMCSMNAIYTYLRGRADGVIGRGEPPRPEKSDKSEAAKDYEYSCLGF